MSAKGVARGVSAHGGTGGGVCLGMYISLVDRMTDTCENITFLQLLLRTVNIFTIKWMFSEVASNCVSKFRSNKN